MVEIPPQRIEALRADHALVLEQCRGAIAERMRSVIEGRSGDELWNELLSRRDAHFTLTHLEQLIPFLADPTRKKRCLNAITQIFHEKSSEERIVALDFLLAQLPTLHDQGIGYALANSFENATPFQQHQILQKLAPFISDPKNMWYIRFFLQARSRWHQAVLPLLQERWSKAKEYPSNENLKYLGDALESKIHAVSSAARRCLQLLIPDGIPLSIIQFWQRNGSAESAILRNLPIMLQLEVERPSSGICKTLHENFGICHFGRYPAAQLLAQFDERESMKPYGIIAIGNEDSNGAFNDMSQTCKRLGEQTKEIDMLLRVIEFSSPMTFARRLLCLRQKYANEPAEGQRHRIGFAVLETHGSTHGLHPGKEITMEHLLDDKTQQLIEACMEPGASICLQSCSTGQESDGVAATLSQKGLHVVGPNRDTEGGDVRIEANEGGDIRLAAMYRNAHAVEYYNGIRENSRS